MALRLWAVLPADLHGLIAAMARSNPTWGVERIVAELLLKLGLRGRCLRTTKECFHLEGQTSDSGDRAHRPHDGVSRGPRLQHPDLQGDRKERGGGCQGVADRHAA